MTATPRSIGDGRDGASVGGGGVGWLVQTGCPPGVHWLGPREAAVVAGLRVARRRDEWLLGRWTAKRALIAAGLAAAPRRVEILAAADGAPEPWIGHARVDASLSISHRAGVALAAVSAPGAPLGCDVELVEPRSAAFVRDYYTDAERALLATVPPDERAARTVLMWSAKEAALKALRTGLRRDTRTVVVSWPAPGGADDTGAGGAGGWRPVTIRDATTGRRFLGRWRELGAHLLTIAIEARSGDDRAPHLIGLSETTPVSPGLFD